MDTLCELKLLTGDVYWLGVAKLHLSSATETCYSGLQYELGQHLTAGTSQLLITRKRDAFGQAAIRRNKKLRVGKVFVRVSLCYRTEVLTISVNFQTAMVNPFVR